MIRRITVSPQSHSLVTLQVEIIEMIENKSLNSMPIDLIQGFAGD